MALFKKKKQSEEETISAEIPTDHVSSLKQQEYTDTKIKGWKEKTDTRLDRIEQQLNDVKTDIDSLHKAIIGKISDYDKNLLDVGTEVKAMEKVFSKIIPTLTESINELSLATKKIKSKK